MPDRDPNHLYPAFRVKLFGALEEMANWLAIHAPGHSVALIEGFRSSARQQELFAQGRTKPGQIVTQKNGTTNKSNHQSSLAADIGIFRGRKYIEDPEARIMDYWGHCCRAQGLTWGGDWAFKDYPHTEWPTSDKATYVAAKKWQVENGIG